MRGLYTFALTGRIATYKTKTQGVALGYGVLGFQPGHTKLKAHGVALGYGVLGFQPGHTKLKAHGVVWDMER